MEKFRIWGACFFLNLITLTHFNMTFFCDMTGLYSCTISFSMVQVTTKGALPGTSSALQCPSIRQNVMECHLITTFFTLYAHCIQLVLPCPSNILSPLLPLNDGSSSHVVSGEKSVSTDVSSETNRWQGRRLVASVFLYKSGFNSRNSAFSDRKAKKKKKKKKFCIIWTRVYFYNLP